MIHLLGILALIYFSLKTLGFILHALSKECLEYRQYKQVDETLKNSTKVLNKPADRLYE